MKYNKDKYKFSKPKVSNLYLITSNTEYLTSTQTGEILSEMKGGIRIKESGEIEVLNILAMYCVEEYAKINGLKTTVFPPLEIKHC